MGLFLSMSGVVGGDEDEIASALRKYASTHAGTMEAEDLKTDDNGCLVLSESVGGATVLYPGDFLGWDDVSQYLSKELDKPTFSFHIHDGDLWMYVLFEDGQVVDQFNPLPDYWEELEDEERLTWSGNARAIAERVPGLVLEQISNYLVPWSDEILESTTQPRAYPADQYGYGNEWQLVDFMSKLGLDYPVDDRGEPHGTTYRFLCESR